MDFKINIPGQAIDYYNQKADELLLKLEPIKRGLSTGRTPSSTSHLYSQTIDAKDIKNLSISSVDGFGNVKSKYFDTSNGQVGLCNNNYDACRKIVEELSQKKGLCEIVSYEFLHDTIFRWFSEKYKGKIKQEIKFLHYLSEEIPGIISEYMVAFPISFMTIENPFKVGKVRIDILRKNIFDEYEKKSLESVNDENEINLIKNGIIKIRKKYQGKVCATIKVKAEKNKAIDTAKLEVENALTILKFFSPSAFLPEIPNFVGRMGQIMIPESHIFIFEDDLPEMISSIDENKYPFWHIDKKALSMMNKSGIKVFSDLSIKKDPTPFEEICLISIKYFTKAISSREYHDRLVFAIVSIEALLLKDKTEKGIQENTSRRLTVLNGGNNNQKEMTSLIDKAYHYRNSYLHHGEKGSILEILNELQLKIWTAIEKAVHMTSNFENKLEFIEYLDERA